jgi:hypothetical protein
MQKRLDTVVFSIFVAALASPALLRLSLVSSLSDVMAHFEISRDLISQGQWLSYSAYYPIIYILTMGGQENLAQLSSFLLLMILTGIKAGTALHFARRWLPQERLAQLVALTYTFAMPIVNPFRPDDVYLGQFSANVWHNSTTILASIFVLPAFWFGLQALEKGGRRTSIFFMLSLLGLVASKPSFALTLGPTLAVVALWQAWKYHDSGGVNRLVALGTASIPAAILILAQYIIVFQQETMFVDRTTVFAPFEVWTMFTNNIPFSFLSSLVGPAIVIWALGIRRFFADKFLVISMLTFVVALLQYVLLAEAAVNGDFLYEGNWTWAVIPALAVVFFRSTAITISNLASQDVSHAEKIPWAIAGTVILLHVASGIYYVFNVGVDGFRTFV